MKKPSVSKNPALHRLGSRLRALALAGAVCVAAAALLCAPDAAGQGAAEGISTCLYTLIPSLFPFMVLCTYVTESGLATRMGRFTGPVMRALFRLPGAAAPVVLLGFIGGYPAGARGVSRLLARGEITREEAGRMLCFCVGAGPPFVLTAVGSLLLGSAQAGPVLLLAVTASGLLLGLLLRFTAPKSAPKAAPKPQPPSPSPFVNSVTGAGRAMAVLCAFVIVFSVVLSLCREAGLFRPLTRFLLLRGMGPGNAAALPSFLAEVTAGCRDGAQFGASLPLFAFGLGWGGLCVHLQIFSFFPELPLSRWKFWLFRLLHGLGAAGLTWVLLPFFPEAAAASALWPEGVTGKTAASIPAAAALFLLLLIMALDGAQLLPLAKRKQNRAKNPR